MSFLENLPCQNPTAFTGALMLQRRYRGPVTRSFGQGKTYMPVDEDTVPPAEQVIKNIEENVLIRYLEKKTRDENRILEKTGTKQASNSLLRTPTSPFRQSTDYRSVISDQDLNEIDSSLDTPSRVKRRQPPLD